MVSIHDQSITSTTTIVLLSLSFVSNIFLWSPINVFPFCLSYLLQTMYTRAHTLMRHVYQIEGSISSAKDENSPTITDPNVAIRMEL